MSQEDQSKLHDDVFEALGMGMSEVYKGLIAGALGVPAHLLKEDQYVSSTLTTEQLRRDYYRMMIEPGIWAFEKQFNNAMLQALTANQMPAILISFLDLKIMLRLLEQANYTWSRQGSKHWYKVTAGNPPKYVLDLYVDVYSNVEPGKILTIGKVDLDGKLGG